MKNIFGTEAPITMKMCFAGGDILYLDYPKRKISADDVLKIMDFYHRNKICFKNSKRVFDREFFDERR